MHGDTPARGRGTCRHTSGRCWQRFDGFTAAHFLLGVASCPEATMLKSKMLSMLAAKAAADPFGKVKKMIKDMIVRLMEEANEETEHKGWCDSELGANKARAILA